jgi:hypothetical protein
LGEGVHKIKKKAEQISCETAIRNLSGFWYKEYNL